MSSDADAKPVRPRVAPEFSGDYEVLSEGYYRCQDAELSGARPDPTCADAVDAYVVPIALEKAALAGLPVPEWFLSNELFPPPCVVYGVNPFSRGYAFVRDEAQREAAAAKFTWRKKYVLCGQIISDATEVVALRVVRGHTESPGYERWAADIDRVFRIPLATVRLLRTGDDVRFSSITVLPAKSLTPRERAWLAEPRTPPVAPGSDGLHG
ncbi:MAG: RimK-like ATPgrasp N-terminal domain-containing protein [Planctomycetes bacterium]|nr:RimK-like ATPgrasp N-terminal domain-containing protein [Planctomycetota bacterium]